MSEMNINYVSRSKDAVKRKTISDTNCRPPAKKARIEITELSLNDKVLQEMNNVCTTLEMKELNIETQPRSRKYFISSQFSGSKAPYTGKDYSLISRFQHVVYTYSNEIKCIENVPYEILEPILRVFDSTRLEAFEKNNPTVSSNTDDLWKRHVQNKFPNDKPDENESWRDRYFKRVELSNRKFAESVKRMKKRYSNVLNKRTKICNPGFILPPHNLEIPSNRYYQLEKQ